MDYNKILKYAKAGEHLKKYGLLREPFYITNDPKDFVGRVKEQEKLVRYLVNMLHGLSNSIIILGNHGVGKTAFIENVYPLVESVKKQLNYDKTFYISGLSDFKNKFFPPENSDIVVEARNSPRKILLFIDDLDVIYDKYAHQIYEIIDPSRFHVVGTWNVSSWKRIREGGKSYRMPKSEIVYLENLKEDESKEIIKRRFNNSASDPKKAKTTFSDKVISLLHNYSKGNPFVLITYSKRLLDFLINEGLDCCDEDVFDKFVEKDILKRRFDPGKADSLSPKEREIFDLLIEKIEVTAEELSKEMKFKRTAAVKYLRKLEGEGLLHSKRKGRKMWYYVPMDIVYTIEDG